MIPRYRWAGFVTYSGGETLEVKFDRFSQLDDLIEDHGGMYAIKRIEISPPQWSEPVTLGGDE